MIEPDSKPRLWITLALAAAAVGAARAETTLVLTPEIVYCTEITWRPHSPGPGYNVSSCLPRLASPFEIGVFLWPGTTDFMYERRLTYWFNYTYADDGLATGNSSFESATLSFRTSEFSGSASKAISVSGAPADAFSYEWGDAVLGDNDHPDSFSGRVRVDLYVPAGEGSAAITGLVPVLSVASAPGGGVPPIPEPSTYALMLAGLGAIGVWAQRRRAASASR